MKKYIKFGKSRKEPLEPFSEKVHLDDSKGLAGILYQVGLFTINAGDSLSKEKLLFYINNAVNFLVNDAQNNRCQIPDTLILEEWEEENIKEKYFFLFRCLLLHKYKEVRVAGLRLHRYLINNGKDVQSIIKCNSVPIIVRCIDLCLDNHMERVHGMRLARQILQCAPELFPLGLARCLVAISRDGGKSRDRLLRAAQALLCELAVLNPKVFVDCGGVSCCLYSILDCSLSRINEALLSGILFLLNDPQWRSACTQFHMIVAPFSDHHYKHCDNDGEYFSKSEEQELRIKSCCLALLAALRSWPGCITLYQPQEFALQGLIDLLLSPQESTRIVILDFLYDLLRVPLGECYSDYETALKEHFTIMSPDPDAWKLHEGFVVSEAKVLLPHVAKFRPNLIQNYFSLLLYILMKNGLFSALCTVIVTSSQYISIKATILLGELLHQADKNIPDHDTMFHALPVLSEEAAGTNAEKRVRASQAITALLQISRSKLSQKDNKSMSLFLSSMLSDAKDPAESDNTGHDIFKKDHAKWFGKDHDELIQQTLKGVNMISDEANCSDWKWENVLPILKLPSESLLLLEEAIYRTFLWKLLSYFKPSSKQFSILPNTHHTAKIQAKVLLAFCEFLLRIPLEEQEKYLWSLLVDINLELRAVVCERPSHDYILSPSRLNTTMCQYYFLAIGLLTKSTIGYEMLMKSTIFDQLLKVIELSYSDFYAKLIITSLDYYIDGMNRVILTKILTEGKESCRMYATQLFRVFIRAQSRGFFPWGIKLLVNQLHDESRLVALAALDILDEAFDDEVYQDCVLKASLSIDHLGDKGHLLLAKMISFPQGFQTYQERNLISIILDKWSITFNLKYVKLMQTALAESLTQLQRGEDGFYGRRTGSKHVVHDVYLLPHLYGSLSLHKEGFSILIQHKSIDKLIVIIKVGHVSSMQEVSKLKAAIWALGHLGRSTDGINFLVSKGVVVRLIDLAASCSVYSVRGTVFHALCCIAVTQDGVNELQKHGWESVRRHHHDPVQFFTKESTDKNKEDQSHIKINDISDYDIETNEIKAGFYIPDESEDEADSSLSLLLEDLYEGDMAPRKSQTLPHDSRPPSYVGHQRSFSDCAPVIEEKNGFTLPSVEAVNSSKKSSQFKTKILSSFRRRSSKRRDSTGSRTSNSSSTSEKMLSFLKPIRRKRDSSSDSGGQIVESLNLINPPNQTLKEHIMSYDDYFNGDDSVLITRKDKLSKAVTTTSNIVQSQKLNLPSVSGTSTSDQKSLSSSPMPFKSTLSPPGSSVPNVNYSFHKHRTFSAHRRGISESSHDEPQPKNSLRDFLSSSLDQSSYNYRNMLDVRNVGRSPSGCSELSSVISSGALGTRGGSSNWLFVKSGGVGTQTEEIISELHPSGQCYLGLALPIDLDKLLYDSSYSRGTQSLDFFSKDTLPVLPESHFNSEGCKKEDSAFEFHSKKLCITCCRLSDPPLDEKGGCFDKDAGIKSFDHPQNRYLVRKEILKFVSNLSNSYIAKPSEAGLLTLKHQHPRCFQDSCLYSEIYVLLSSYSYRLDTRRFIQELFLELSFKEVFDSARKIIAESEKLYGNLISGSSVLNKSESNDFNDIPEYNLNDFAGFEMQEEL